MATYGTTPYTWPPWLTPRRIARKYLLPGSRPRASFCLKVEAIKGSCAGTYKVQAHGVHGAHTTRRHPGPIWQTINCDRPGLTCNLPVRCHPAVGSPNLFGWPRPSSLTGLTHAMMKGLLQGVQSHMLENKLSSHVVAPPPSGKLVCCTRPAAVVTLDQRR